MSSLKKFQPTFLHTDKNGKLYTKLCFDSYEDLSLMICGLNSTVSLISHLLTEDSYPSSFDDVGEALIPITRIIKQLDWAIYGEFILLDKLREALDE